MNEYPYCTSWLCPGTEALNRLIVVSGRGGIISNDPCTFLRDCGTGGDFFSNQSSAHLDDQTEWNVRTGAFTPTRRP